MSRRAPIVIVALVAILLAMATAAQPVQLWVAPTLGNTSPSADDSTAAMGMILRAGIKRGFGYCDAGSALCDRLHT